MNTNNTIIQGSQTATQGSITTPSTGPIMTKRCACGKLMVFGETICEDCKKDLMARIMVCDPPVTCDICGCEQTNLAHIYSNARISCCRECYNTVIQPAIKRLKKQGFTQEKIRSHITEYGKQVTASFPSDVVEVDDAASISFINLWNPQGMPQEVPSDIIFAGTVPIYDTEIVCYTGNKKMGTLRVVLNKDVVSSLKTAAPDEDVVVGVMLGVTAVPLYVRQGCNNIIIAQEDIDIATVICGEENASDILIYLLSVWYGIQISLLHPDVKTVFSNPQPAPYKKSTHGKKHKGKKIITYVKKHIIKGDVLDEVLNSRKTKRTALCWYVIGHWRTYKSGVKIFIKGFWKGVLRDTKKSSEVRTREFT